MACTKVIQVRRDIIAYLPNIPTILSVIRRNNLNYLQKNSLCTASASLSTQTGIKGSTNRTAAAAWPLDPKYPLPGNTAVDVHQVSKQQIPSIVEKSPYCSLAGALLQVEDEEMRKFRLLNEFVQTKAEDSANSEFEDSATSTEGIVELTASKCPDKLCRSFLKMFSSLPDGSELTVINICQKTKNDMSMWSADVKNEREELLHCFISNASDICEQLQSAGYWADFVDPSSGQAFFSDHSNETLFETDERYNSLGFEIDDLGCCKVVRHKTWGTHIFLGSIFTNASPESALLKGFTN